MQSSKKSRTCFCFSLLVRYGNGIFYSGGITGDITKEKSSNQHDLILFNPAGIIYPQLRRFC